jgi:hypothetical protein
MFLHPYCLAIFLCELEESKHRLEQHRLGASLVWNQTRMKEEICPCIFCYSQDTHNSAGTSRSLVTNATEIIFAQETSMMDGTKKYSISCLNKR